MTKEDYKAKLDAAEAEYMKTRNNILLEYAAGIREFGIGDIIKEEDGSIIRIERFGTIKYGEYPTPTYTGPMLKKDLTPRKDASTDTIHYGRATLVKKAEI